MKTPLVAFTLFISLVLLHADESPAPSGPQTDGNFQKVVLVSDEQKNGKYEDTLVDPMELSIASDGRVFFAERPGTVKVWKPDTKSTIVLGKLNPFTGLEDGLLGIALDPNFEKTGWVYLNYSLPETGTDANGKKCGTNRVSRFTIKGDVLDLKSEKPIIDIPTQREQCCHAGGSLAFDKDGNLYISTGDNTNPFESDGFAPIDERTDRGPWDAQKSSSNANDLRGKVLRIHPKANGTYTIPKGNLFELPARSNHRKPERGAEHLILRPPTAIKPLNARPEVYVMGCRNPFRISIDPKTEYLYWGDVGPDAQGYGENRGPAGHDEINQARQAGFFGWPYFVGDNKPYFDYDFSSKANGSKYDPIKPINASPNNTGLNELPAAQPALIYYPSGNSVKFPAVGSGGRTAMAGPVYYFDSSLQSDRKLPSQFDHTLFIYEWSRNWIAAVHLDKDDKIAKMERLFPNMTFKRPMDMELGPDGCLYVIEWGTAWGNNKDTQIVRLEHKSAGNKLVASPGK